MKTSKYLVCNDFFTKEEELSEFILHTQHPRFLAKVEALDFDEMENQPEKPFADVLYVNGQGTMDIYRLEVCQYLEKADEDDVLDEILDHIGDMIIDGDIEQNRDVGANDGSDFVDGTNVT